MPDEPELCRNCESPVADDAGWVVTTAEPKAGAALTEDYRCRGAGAFCYDHDEPEM